MKFACTPSRAEHLVKHPKEPITHLNNNTKKTKTYVCEASEHRNHIRNIDQKHVLLSSFQRKTVFNFDIGSRTPESNARKNSGPRCPAATSAQSPRSSEPELRESVFFGNSRDLSWGPASESKVGAVEGFHCFGWMCLVCGSVIAASLSGSRNELRRISV